MFILGSYSLMLSLCGGVRVCKVIFVSNPTAVLRLRLCCVVVGVVTIFLLEGPGLTTNYVKALDKNFLI